MADRTATTSSVTTADLDYDVDETARSRELARARREHDGVEEVEILSYDQQEERRGAPRASLEGWAVAIFFAVVYGIIGYFMLTDGHIVNFDSLHRLNEAYMAWWNSPPRLSALTLNAAPIGAALYMPLALIKPLATSLTAIPVLTAVAAGILMAMINSILRRCEVPVIFRLPMLVLFGLNPMLIFYAGNGDITVLGMVLIAISLLALISWQMSDETRHLVAAGLATGLAVMIDYGYAVWAIGFTIAIIAINHTNRHSDDRSRSSMLLYLAPIVYGLLVWTLLNWIILDSPFGWISAQTGMIQVNTTGALQAVTSNPTEALGDLFSVVLGIAPLGFATVILLFLAGIFGRDGLSWGFIALIISALAVPMSRVLYADQADLMTLSVGLPLALLALAGAAWVFYAQEGWRIGVGLIMVIGLIAAIPLGWDAMKTYDYQDQAQAFTRWAEDRDSQEGTSSIGGYTVGIDPERAMASYINNELPQVYDSILVDENFSYGPMILSGRPYLFVDRADGGESDWEAARDSPFGKVDYMLVTVSRGGDQMRKTFPMSVTGGEPGMTPIFRTARYVLVEVAATRPQSREEQDSAAGGTQPQSTPRPVTPVRPQTPAAGEPTESTPAAPQSTPDSTTAPSSSTGSGSSDPALEGE